MKKKVIWNPSKEESELLHKASQALEDFCNLQDECCNCPLNHPANTLDCSYTILSEDLENMAIIS